MSGLIVERSIHRLADHVILCVRPAVNDVQGDDLDGWAQHAEDAVSVAGVLSRVALKVSGALEATAQDHKCLGVLYRDDVDGAEVVDAERFHGCRLFLVTGEADGHILAGGRMPHLIVHVPPNRVRAWTEHLTRAVDQVLALDHTALTAAPPMFAD